MTAHLEAIAQLRASQGYVDRATVLHASAGDDEISTLVRCSACTGNRGGWCIRSRAAGLGLASFQLGDMAEMLQNCPAYVPRTQRGDAR